MRWWRSLAESPPIDRPTPSADDIRRAAEAGAGAIRETPVLSSRTLTERAGMTVALKAENLQRTGSFKIRGALAKIAALGSACEQGVVCASAGNHAQAVAYAASERGVPCCVFMPEGAPIAKAEATLALGAEVRLVGESVDESLAAARQWAAAEGQAFVHPFDDPDVVAGQGTLGVELVAQVPDLTRVVVPVGGGGLISGVAIAVKSERPDVEVIGVQAAACAPYPASLRAGEPLAVLSAMTIADGIAVKRPGAFTLRLIRKWVDDVVVVSEEEVAEAMVFLLERAKLVVEGAGAVGVAAILAGRVGDGSRGGTTAVILSGGNVDPGLLSDVVRRHESQVGRRLVLLARLPDRPGSLALLLSLVGQLGANLLDVEHIREGFDLHVRESAVQLVLETRGPGHAAEVQGAIRDAGYYEPVALR
ncbi:MAG TPA: threonine ammonia-lyase [Solirubrobacteraceae bacterium]|nr:threonine ammonia-lyase [Solirubrobacteraceae bacterium]